MITKSVDGKSVLKIFDNFLVDRSLPKYKKETEEVAVNRSSGFVTISTQGTSSINWGTGSNAIIVTPNQTPPKRRVIRTAINSFAEWFQEKRRNSPEEVFKKVIKGHRALEQDYEARSNAIISLKLDAQANGQTALYESILDAEKRLSFEAILATSGFTKFLDEADMIEFSEQCIRGLKLDWIKNFSRLIPKDVQSKKRHADSLLVFDNYVILHYDPVGKGSRLTAEEIRQKKDPILFGVMENSRRLYFVGDWKDEFCDLTFDEVITKLAVEPSSKVLP